MPFLTPQAWYALNAKGRTIVKACHLYTVHAVADRQTVQHQEQQE